MGMLLSVGRTLTPTEEQLADQTFHRLYDLHKQGMASKGLLAFIHVSKAAGSTICLLGERNKCTTQVFGANGGKGNCLVVRFDDVPRWISLPQHSKYFPKQRRYPYVNHGVTRRSNFSCAARKAIMRRQGWSFYANEYTLIPPIPGSLDAGLCMEFAHLLVFRHPYARLLSHIRYIYEQYSLRYLQVRASIFSKFSSHTWSLFAPAATDNYYIRTLLGEAVYNAPPEALTTLHLQQAQEVVAGVEVLLDSNNELVDQYNLKMGLGWRYGLGGLNVKKGGSAKVSEESNSIRVPKRLRTLFHNNRLDVELYHFTELLAGLDAAMYRHLAGGVFWNNSLVLAGSRYPCGWVGLRRGPLPPPAAAAAAAIAGNGSAGVHDAALLDAAIMADSGPRMGGTADDDTLV